MRAQRLVAVADQLTEQVFFEAPPAVLVGSPNRHPASCIFYLARRSHIILAIAVEKEVFAENHGFFAKTPGFEFRNRCELFHRSCEVIRSFGETVSRLPK